MLLHNETTCRGPLLTLFPAPFLLKECSAPPTQVILLSQEKKCNRILLCPRRRSKNKCKKVHTPQEENHKKRKKYIY